MDPFKKLSDTLQDLLDSINKLSKEYEELGIIVNEYEENQEENPND